MMAAWFACLQEVPMSLERGRIWTGAMKLLIRVATAAVFFVAAARADAQALPLGCNAPLETPSVTVTLPGNPFAVKPSADGCWVFASVGGGNPGIAVLKRGNRRIDLVRVVSVPSAPAGIVLTHDGKLLIAAAASSVAILDVERMTTGAEMPIAGTFSGPDRGFSGAVYVNVTSDDKLLFVSQESAQMITVIDLERARQNRYSADSILGNIPVGVAPIALTFSPDGKWLYTTSEVAAPDWKWPKACRPEGPPITREVIAARQAAVDRQISALQSKQVNASEKEKAQLQEQIDWIKANVDNSSSLPLVSPEGAVVVVDVARARTDPEQSVAARIPAGCSAVRMAISPDGGRIYVTARNDNAVGVFDTSKLLADPAHARLGTAAVGEAPVPVAVIDRGRKVVVGNSNRFAAATAPQTLSVLDAAKMEQPGADALGAIASGAFPREFSVSSDGQTLFLTNAGSSSLQVLDIAHLPVDPTPRAR
jgi:DNA-binding beta-propeller fold protein YncE